MQQLDSRKQISRKLSNVSLLSLQDKVSWRLGSFTTLHLYRLEDEDQAAQLLLQEVVYYLERRVAFRRLKSLLMQELEGGHIEGIRVVCSGRVGGRSKKAQRAKKEGFQLGQTSSNVFSSRLAFACGSGLTSFGKVGVKVWICYKQ